MKSNREYISIIQYCVMSTSHSKEVVDHEGDLSPSSETGPLFGLSAPRGRPSSWTGNSGWYCSEPRQSSRPASQNLENLFHMLIVRMLAHPKNQQSPFLWSITQLPTENQNHLTPVFWILFSTSKMMMDWGTCRIAVPIFAVLAVRPRSSAEYPLDFKNSQSTVLSQIPALEFCHNYVRLHLSELFLLLPGDPRELLLDFFARRQMKFCEEDLEVNQT